MSGRADLSPPDAIGVAREVWGLDAQTAEALPGERDSNFLIRCGNGESWVLKVAPADASEDDLRLEVDALRWLSRRDGALPVPRLRHLPDGRAKAQVTDHAGNQHTARLVNHLPGRLLANVRPRAPELLRDLGRLLARLDQTLTGFRPPVARAANFIWDLRNAGTVIDRGMPALPDAQRALLEPVLTRFREVVEPLLGRLPVGFVHGDANDYNVLVELPTHPGASARISGLIDFGDLLEAPRVVEPAVAAAYAILGERDPVHAAAALVSGYHDELPLSEDEVEVLWDLVLARLAVSVAISAQRSGAGSTDPYVTVSEGPAWDVLQRVGATHPRHARDVLRAACAYEPCPRSARVQEWLKTNRVPRHVLPADVMARPLVLDLSVSTNQVAAAVGPVNAGPLGREIDDLLGRARASVGVGRYREPRALYREAHFDHPSGDPLLKRSVHIAVDLFAPAGTPVLVPLDGSVQSCVDNAGASNYGPTVILEHAVDGEVTFWTLYGHLSRESIAKLSVGQVVSAGTELARLGAPFENGEWPPHLHFQLVTDLLDQPGDFAGVASSHELDVWTSLSPDPGLLIELPEGTGAPPESTIDSLLGRRHDVLGRNLSVSYRRPLHIVRGKGQHLFDAGARAFLDCVNNVAHVGHAHPRVVEAVARQKAALETNTRYLNELVVRFGERLAETLPDPLRVCWFVNSGSEANELALRLAWTATRRRDVVVLEGAYHGNTTTLIDVSPYKHAGAGGLGAPDWVHVAAVPDDYRGPYRRSDPERGKRYAARVAEAVGRASSLGREPAAFLHESLLSCAGQIDPAPGYLAAAYAAVRAAGGVTIADEVQVGLGRVGSHFWGFETQGVIPDIVTVGKPLGNGHPLAAVITTPQIAAAFDNGMEYFNTFGGNPASCAAGLAVLDVIRDEGLQARALQVGDRLRNGLSELAQRHPAVGDVRGRGLFLGVEIVAPSRGEPEPDGALADHLVQRARERGVLLSTDGPAHNVIKIKPPMVFEGRDADRVVELLDELLGENFARDR